MQTSFVNYNPETKETFQLRATVTAKGNEILAGSFFNGWVGFNTPDQKWRHPYRIIRTQSGKFYKETFQIKTPAQGSRIWELTSRELLSQEYAENIIEEYKEMSEYDDDYFVN